MEIIDQYHSLEELYEHRHILFLCFAKKVVEEGLFVWKSKLHYDGSFVEGYFIMGVNTEFGSQISYHLPLSKWHYAYFATEMNTAPKFDNHTSKDVLNRLTEQFLNELPRGRAIEVSGQRISEQT